VHCAGIAEPPGSSILAITSEAWHALLDAHLTRVFESCRAAPPSPGLVAPLYVLLASTLSHPVTGQPFSAAGGYVGLHAKPRERLVGFRDVATQGPWPLEERAARVHAALEAP
jgi:hypothetical protein